VTEVAFHLNVPDVEAYACRLLRKAFLKGARVSVLADDPLSQSLDRRLWLMGQGDFVPHASETSAQRVIDRSPILIGAVASEDHGAAVLVNLTTRLPETPQRFERVIEIVGTGEADLANARGRWKAYRSAGLKPLAIDLADGAEG
jgi:DNA polymerase-3 subunit chi